MTQCVRVRIQGQMVTPLSQIEGPVHFRRPVVPFGEEYLWIPVPSARHKGGMYYIFCYKSFRQLCCPRSRIFNYHSGVLHKPVSVKIFTGVLDQGTVRRIDETELSPSPKSYSPFLSAYLT